MGLTEDRIAYREAEQKAAAGLKRGDVITVTRCADTHEGGWKNSWTREMTHRFNEGREMTVLATSVLGTGISLDDGCRYPYFVLKKNGRPLGRSVKGGANAMARRMFRSPNQVKTSFRKKK